MSYDVFIIFRKKY